MPARPGHTPRTKPRPPGGLGKCQAGDGAPERDRAPRPRQQPWLTMWQEAPPASSPQFTIWQGPCGPLQRLCLCLSREATARRGWGGPLAPLALTLSAAVPSAPRLSLPAGRAGPPVRHSRAPPPCPAGPEPRLPRPPHRSAIGCLPAGAAAPLAAFAVHQSRPTPLSYGPGVAEEPHPRRPRKESKYGGVYHEGR